MKVRMLGASGRFPGFTNAEHAGNKQFFSEVGEDGLNRKRFRTSGNVVTVLTVLTLLAYVSLLVLTVRLGI